MDPSGRPRFVAAGAFASGFEFPRFLGAVFAIAGSAVDVSLVPEAFRDAVEWNDCRQCKVVRDLSSADLLVFE